MTDTGESAWRVRWQPGRFYWGLLDAPAGASRGAGRERLDYRFEGVLPGIPIERMHAVYTRLADGRWLACGIEEEVLRRDTPEGALQLVPDALPPFITEDVDTSRLNLLTGSFLPARLRRSRGIRRWSLLAILIVCAATVMVGLERRVAALRGDLAMLAEARSGVYEDLIGPEAAGSGLPPEQELIAELRRLRQTRQTEVPGGRIGSSAAVLSEFLGYWPAGIRTRTESLVVTPRQVMVTTRVESMDMAQEFADAFESWPGWEARPHNAVARGDGVHLSLRFRSAAEGGRR